MLAPASLLLTGARLAPATAPIATDVAAHETLDIRILEGRISEIGRGLRPVLDEEVVDADGRQAIPGLWDQHVHMGQWSLADTRVDLAGTRSVREVLDLVAQTCAGAEPGEVVEGFGYRAAHWITSGTTAELDAVVGERCVVLISADAHSGWLSTAAFRALGVAPTPGLLTEHAWFDVFARLSELPGSERRRDAGLLPAVRAASAMGVVGVGDMEFDGAAAMWAGAVAAGMDCLRVRVATYPEQLDAVRAARLHTGDLLRGGGGLVRQGSVKIILDGTLGTRTASCCEPFTEPAAGVDPRGEMAYTVTELTDLMSAARAAFLDVAVHAIGDAAAATALDAFAATGVGGSLEHAQLLRREDISRLAALSITASMQPAHLLDDRDLARAHWPDRLDRCYQFATLLHEGVNVVLGSDAPVAPLDPWHTMAAAVHRTADDRDPWNPAEALTPGQALRCSVDGQRLAPGARGDVVLLDDDFPADDLPSPLAAQRLRAMKVGATILAGRVVHQA